MKVKLNTEKLNDILSTFYQMNGIRIAIFDDEYNEIMEYPKEKCEFCRTVRRDPHLNDICHSCDIESIKICERRNDIYIYKCHAGLVEAVTPLKHDGKTIGYIMLGQITDIKSKTALRSRISAFNQMHGLECDITGIKFRSKKQIISAAKILEICAEYIMLKDIIVPENDRIIARAEEFIKENLESPFTVEDICEVCNCSRTKLYEMFRAEYNIGVAHYINEMRMQLANNLLRTTSLSVSDISARCGFCDYNYFGRVYKKRFGMSPRSVRKSLM